MADESKTRWLIVLLSTIIVLLCPMAVWATEMLWDRHQAQTRFDNLQHPQDISTAENPNKTDITFLHPDSPEAKALARSQEAQCNSAAYDYNNKRITLPQLLKAELTVLGDPVYAPPGLTGKEVETIAEYEIKSEQGRVSQQETKATCAAVEHWRALLRNIAN